MQATFTVNSVDEMRVDTFNNRIEIKANWYPSELIEALDTNEGRKELVQQIGEDKLLEEIGVETVKKYFNLITPEAE